MSIINYCPNCSGKPYTRDLKQKTCPVCQAALRCEVIDDAALSTRRELSFVSEKGKPMLRPTSQSDSAAFSVGSKSNTHQPLRPQSATAERSGGYFGPSKPLNTQIPAREDRDSDTFSDSSPDDKVPIHRNNVDLQLADERVLEAPGFSSTKVHGKVYQYSNTILEGGNYRRLFFQKIYDAIVYRQRCEDILHRFKVRIEHGNDSFGAKRYTDVEVNVHGTLTSGSRISDNTEVEVTGKYREGVLWASNIEVVNNGYRSPVNFQHSAKAVIYVILAICSAILLSYIGISSNGGFLDNIGAFARIWLISAAVLTVLYLLAIFSKIGIMTRIATGKPNKFPLLGIILMSLIIALIVFYNSGIGATIGNALMSLLSSAISIAVFLGVIYYIFRLLIK